MKNVNIPNFSYEFTPTESTGGPLNISVVTILNHF